MNAAGFRYRPVTVRDRVRAVIERVLPWYDPALETQRKLRTTRIHRMSIAARKGAERAMDPSRLASYGRVRIR